MKKVDLKNLKIPLSKKTFKELKMDIRTGKIKWMDMSRDLMFAYQDFWKSDKYRNMNETTRGNEQSIIH